MQESGQDSRISESASRYSFYDFPTPWYVSGSVIDAKRSEPHDLFYQSHFGYKEPAREAVHLHQFKLHNLKSTSSHPNRWRSEVSSPASGNIWRMDSYSNINIGDSVICGQCETLASVCSQDGTLECSARGKGVIGNIGEASCIGDSTLLPSSEFAKQVKNG